MVDRVRILDGNAEMERVMFSLFESSCQKFISRLTFYFTHFHFPLPTHPALSPYLSYDEGNNAI